MRLQHTDLVMLMSCYDRWVKTFRHAELLTLPDTAAQQCCFRFISGYQHMDITIPAWFDAESYAEPWSLTSTAFSQLMDAWLEDHDVVWRPTVIVARGIEIPVMRFSTPFTDQSFSTDFSLAPDTVRYVFNSLYKFMDTDATNISRRSVMFSRADRKVSLYATNGHILGVFTFPAFKQMTEEDPFCLEVANAKLVHMIMQTCTAGVLCDSTDIAFAFNRDMSKLRIAGPSWSCVFTSGGRSCIKPSSVRMQTTTVQSASFITDLWKPAMDDLRRMLYTAGVPDVSITLQLQATNGQLTLKDAPFEYQVTLPIYRTQESAGVISVNSRYLLIALSVLRSMATLYIDPFTPLLHFSEETPSPLQIYISPIK